MKNLTQPELESMIRSLHMAMDSVENNFNSDCDDRDEYSDCLYNLSKIETLLLNLQKQ
jgi:hypothetical protein